MIDFNFVSKDVVIALHRLQIERFGGAAGLRDDSMLDSALSRPLNKAVYGCEDVFEIAAAYLFGLAKNHAFVDGNKRIAIVTAAVFLMDNGYDITASEAELYTFVLAVAAGEIDEDGATRFFADFAEPMA